MNGNIMLLSDSPEKDYESFLLEGMKRLREFDVIGLVLAVKLGNKDREADVMTGCFNLEPSARMACAAHIQADAIAALVDEKMKEHLDDDGEDDA